MKVYLVEKCDYKGFPIHAYWYALKRTEAEAKKWCLHLQSTPDADRYGYCYTFKEISTAEIIDALYAGTEILMTPIPGCDDDLTLDENDDMNGPIMVRFLEAYSREDLRWQEKWERREVGLDGDCWDGDSCRAFTYEELSILCGKYNVLSFVLASILKQLPTSLPPASPPVEDIPSDAGGHPHHGSKNRGDQ